MIKYFISNSCLDLQNARYNFLMISFRILLSFMSAIIWISWLMPNFGRQTNIEHSTVAFLQNCCLTSKINRKTSPSEHLLAKYSYNCLILECHQNKWKGVIILFYNFWKVNEEEFLQAVTTEPENFDVQTIFYFDMIPPEMAGLKFNGILSEELM